MVPAGGTDEARERRPPRQRNRLDVAVGMDVRR